jgi:tripartite-type tricarboxylate transporter receptor subunit TctC
VIARFVGQGLSARWSQQVVIENKAGASGDIGSASVASAAPDGYTLLLFGDGILINQALVKNRPFDAIKNFTPVTLVARSPQVLVASPTLNVTSLRALIDLAKSGKADLVYGTAGVGSPGNIAGALFAARTNISLRHVPYRGGAMVLADLMGNQINLASMGMPAVISGIRAGTIVPLAISTEKRSSILPDVPTMNEIAPGVFVDTWYGVLAPAGVPASIVKKIQEDIAAVLGTPESVARLKEGGYEFIGSTPEELKSVMAHDLPRWKELVALAGLQAQ